MRKYCLVLVFLFFAIPFLFYGVSDLFRIWDRVHVKDDFYIEYLDSHASMSLCNTNQCFVGNVSLAFWNNDSLVVKGVNGCYLIVFGTTKYNDEKIPVDCVDLKSVLKNPPTNSYHRKQ